jgi:hypothetical protein
MIVAQQATLLLVTNLQQQLQTRLAKHLNVAQIVTVNNNNGGN